MIASFVALVLFLVPLAYSPGPGNMFFAANGARFGVLATLPANLGYHLATFVVSAAIGFGFAHFTGQFPQVFFGIKMLGSAYVGWLAWGLLRAGTLGDGQQARPAGFIDGVVLLLLNPKGYVIMVLMFSQFSALNVWGVALIFTLNNMLAFVIWTCVGGMFARRFRKPTQARRLNIGLGLVLMAVAVWMVVS